MTPVEQVDEDNLASTRRWLAAMALLASLYLATGHPTFGTVECLAAVVHANDGCLAGAPS